MSNASPIKKASVKINFRTEDGYSSQNTYCTNEFNEDKGKHFPLLISLEQIARLLKIAGFEKEARKYFESGVK